MTKFPGTPFPSSHKDHRFNYIEPIPAPRMLPHIAAARLHITSFIPPRKATGRNSKKGNTGDRERQEKLACCFLLANSDRKLQGRRLLMKSAWSVRFAMNLAAAVLLSLGITVTADAQSIAGRTRFDFYVGDHKYPQGEYTLNVIAGGQLIQILDRTGLRATLPLTEVSTGVRASKTELVFNHYDDYYFLSEIRRSHSSRSYVLPQSSLERAVARKTVKDRVMRTVSR